MAANQGLNPGDVVLVEIPKSDGHEQYGLRPSVLITGVIKDLVTAVPLTTNQEALSFPYTLEVKPDSNNGLSFISVALLYQIRALDSKRCQRKLGKLSKIEFAKIRAELKGYLKL